MKPITIILLLFITGIFSVNCQESIKVITYNIRLDNPNDAENSWDNRKQWMTHQIQFYAPDVLGVQEALPNQMKDMQQLLADYSYVGVGRDNGNDGGEYSAIFYNNKKFKILESATFWLSQTPEKVSMGWDAVCNRVCTYALFQDKNTKKKFWAFNTHFDHVGKVARFKSAQLIISKIHTLNTKNYPLVLMGDFNLEETNASIQYILKHLHDAKAVSKTPAFGPEGTFNGFDFYKPVTRRIDYIFVDKSVKVNKYAVLSDSKDCKYPSDHLPVLAEIAFK